MRRIAFEQTARHLSLTLLIVPVMSLAALSVFAQSPTFVRTDYSGLGNNQVVGDFNNDGKFDLAGQGAMSAAILLGNGDGTFGARVEYPVANWNQDLAAGDFNGDGKLDLVVTINDPQISLSLLTGNGDGTFGAPVNFPNTSGFDSPAIVATDLEATSTRTNATLQVFVTSSGQLIGTLTNNGGGQYSREFSVSANPQSITVRSSLGGSATGSVIVK